MKNARTLHWYDPGHPAYAATSSKVKEYARDKDYGSIAELISGYIQEAIEIEDIADAVLGPVMDWTAGSQVASDRQFTAPPLVHGNKAVTIENGATLSSAKFSGRKVYVAPETVTTPSYDFDTKDFESGEIADAGRVAMAAMQALLIQKAKRLINLLGMGSDMTDTTDANTKVTVIEDDGTFNSGTDTPTYVPKLKEAIRKNVSKLQDTIGSRENMIGITRQITLDNIAPADIGGVDWYAIPAAEDAEDENRPIFCEGDVILVAPRYAANIAKTMNIESSVHSNGHYEVSFAWRWAHAYVRWDTKYLRRIVVLDTTTPAGVLTVTSFDANSMELYCTKPLKVSTITTSTLIIDDDNPAVATIDGLTYSVTLLGDLRRARIVFGDTKPTAGTTYYIKTTTGIHDIGANATTAMTQVALKA